MIRERNYSLKRRYESNRRNMRYRFESANSGEDLIDAVAESMTKSLDASDY